MSVSLKSVLKPGLAPSTMHAALFYKPEDVRYEETRVPAIVPGEILVRIATALTCGTDLKCYRRGHPVLLKAYPSPFGHEFSGTVAEVGEGVTAFSPGDRVVAANSAPCYTCYPCLKGRHNLCENLDLLNGAYADFLRIPAQIVTHNTYKLPHGLSDEAAAFSEPLAVSLRGVEQAGICSGDRVAVIGVGPIGQLLVKVAKLKGAHVTVLGRNPLKLAMAQTFGEADAVVDLREVPDPRSIRERYTPSGRGFDVVIEAVGLPETWEKSLMLACRGGKVNLFGGCEAGTRVALETSRIHYDEITILSSFHHTPAYFEKALQWIAEGRLDPTPLISNRMPMSRLANALEAVSSGQAVKIALIPDSRWR